MEWLASGLRRDVCILLYPEEIRVQQIKSKLEDRYDRRISPEQYYGAISALDDAGMLEIRVEGLNDVARLTDRGEKGVEAQFAWMKTLIDDLES